MQDKVITKKKKSNCSILCKTLRMINITILIALNHSNISGFHVFNQDGLCQVLRLV